MSYETRQDMTRDLAEISVTRRQMSMTITSSILNNFTSREIALIAQAIGIGDYYKLIELIKR